MNDTERVLNLFDLVKTSHAQIATNADPTLRDAISDALSLVGDMIRDRSWATDPQAKQELLKTLTQTVATLQALSDRLDKH